MIVKLALLILLACPPSVTDPPARAAVREAYGEVLWQMMHLDWCAGRLQQPAVLERAQSRLSVLQSRAAAAGFAADLEEAKRQLDRRMETIRLDTSCRDGLASEVRKSERALSLLDQALQRRVARQR